MENEVKYTHAIVNGNEVTYVFNDAHLNALILEGLSLGWEFPVIISFDEPMTKEEIDRKLND